MLRRLLFCQGRNFSVQKRECGDIRFLPFLCFCVLLHKKIIFQSIESRLKFTCSSICTCFVVDYVLTDKHCVRTCMSMCTTYLCMLIVVIIYLTNMTICETVVNCWAGGSFNLSNLCQINKWWNDMRAFVKRTQFCLA